MKEISIKYYSNFLWCISFCIFLFPFWGLNYTSDWNAYEYTFNNPSFSRDYLLAVLSEFFYNQGYEFKDLYHVHIIAIAFCYLYLFKILNVNPFWFTLLVILFYYVPIANQIRFFLALPLTLIGFYKFVYKKYVSSVLCLAIAILSHYTSILLISSLLVFYRIQNKSILFQFIYLTSANIIVAVLLGFTSAFNERYTGYQNSGQISSALGGIYNLFPYLLPLCLIVAFDIVIKQSTQKRVSTYYKFLYVSSISTCIFIIGGIQTQILTHRFLCSLLPVWGGYFLYCSNNKALRKSHRFKFYWTLSLVLICFWKYILSPYLNVDSSLKEISLMLFSYDL